MAILLLRALQVLPIPASLWGALGSPQRTREVAPLAEQFDVVVIGGGPGGYAALYGAAAGLNIAVVEKEKVGGTCLHRGCIPAKEFLETANVYRTVAGAKEFGVVRPTSRRSTSPRARPASRRSSTSCGRASPAS